MIILDDAHVSHRMQDYLQTTQQPVLQTAKALALQEENAGAFNLVDPDEAVSRVESGERLYAQSESHLDWVLANISDVRLKRAIDFCKDKAHMRAALAPLYPNYFFKVVSAEELATMPFPAHAAPVVLKPNVGFLSLGVFVCATADDWNHAKAEVAAHLNEWGSWYKDSVIAADRFLVEGVIEGTEYAIDAYYDENGNPQIMDILRHDFASEHDTSDRLYLTGPSIIREKAAALFSFLARANEAMGAVNFPVHVEVRETADGTIIPIEFNAMRFAGLGGTEISWFAYGFYTFDHFLNGTAPNWSAILAESDPDALYCMSVLNPPTGTPAGTTMDYGAFESRFAHPLAIDRFDFDATGILGFLFWKTIASDITERRWLLDNDLSEFLH